MTNNILIEATPYNPATSSFVTVRMTLFWADDRGTQLNGYQWMPVINGTPITTRRFASDGVAQAFEGNGGELGFVCGDNYGNEDWSALQWDGATFSMFVAPIGAAWAEYRQVLSGTTSAIKREGAQCSINLSGSEATLNRNLLTASYAGTGNAEGPSELKGTLKPFAAGDCLNIEPILIDPVRFIYQFHNGAAQDVTAVYEQALTLGPASTTASTYNSLRDATLQPGEWIKAPAIGCFRLGAEPTGKITADIKGGKDGSTYPASIATIVPLLIKAAGVPAAKIKTTSFNAFSAVPWSYYTKAQVQIGDVARDALQQAGGYLMADGQGNWQVGNYYATSTATALREDRSALPLVRSIVQNEAAPPVYRVRVGYNRCWAVHSADEISPALSEAQDDIIAAKEAADAAKAAADAAQADADRLIADMDAIAADNVLDRAEKQRVIRDFQEISGEKAGIESRASGAGITTLLTAYTNAYNTLNSYLAGLSPAYTDSSQDTPIVRTTWNSRWVGYTNARTALLREIERLAADMVGSLPASTVANAVTNFNTRNDRNASPVTAPTLLTDGTAITSTANTDGSADIRFAWNWAGSNDDIDGFRVIVRSSPSSSAYTLGGAVGEEQAFELPADRRAFSLYGTAADRFYTFYVQAYRVVDPDVASGGLIVSTAVKSTRSGDNPYRPSATVNFIGKVGGVDAAVLVAQAAAVADANAAIDDLVETYGSTATAAASASAAQASADTSKIASDNAATAKTAAEQAENDAVAAKAAAETARSEALTAATNATTAKTGAETAKTAAETAKTAAQTAKADAEAAFANSTSAKNAAVAAQGAAESARNNAQTFASNASNSATGAAGSATTAATKATEAGNSASAASGSAVTAQAGAENASYLDVAHAWDFANNAVNGFTANGGSLTGQSNGLLYAQTGGDPQLIRTGLSIAGSRYTRVIVDLTRTVASTSNAADLVMFWATAGHSYAAGYRCSPMAVVNPPLNQRTQLTFDLTSAIGSADWLGSTISAIRFDLDSASGGSFLIHSIRVVGPDGLAPSKSATAAATSASAAATSAGAAGTSATAAQTSATNASTKAGEASTSATNAATSESNAKGSENAAKTSQTAAAGSATSAGNSASAAATSASTASTKATEANQSASTATTQATSAATKAGEASASASQAATSESNANASKNAAATSANNAASSANAAGGSATAAAGSANNAQTSASSAGNSASAAAAQAIVAASHATGNLVRKGIFNDGSTGTWSGNVTTITTTITPPDGASRVLRTTNRNSAEGDLIAWPFTTARKLRITGYVLAYGSYLGMIGINAVNAAGTNFWYFVTGSSAGSSSWTTVDGIVTVPADIVGLRAFIVSDGPDSATGHDVRATSMAISDITDADAAAASASAAATSASAAGTSASAAGNSANSATQSANTASTKASEAAGSASSAATSASNAASSSTNAGNSATAANSSNVAATLSAAAQMPSDFQQDGRYWQQGFGGLPSALASITANSTFSFVNNTDVGRSMRVTASGQIDVGNIGMLPLQADRVYRITAKVRQQSGSAFAQLQLYRIGVTTTGGTTANGTVQSTYTFTALNQWVDLSGTVPASTTNAMIAAGASSIRCLLRLLAASSTVTVDYAYIRIEDITESTSAAGSANAAANSASQASASQSSAGSSASSAQSSATTAATKAGEASTSASQASTSASNAAGSANTASQQAGLAAQSAASSGSSASAAAGSASTASTKASEASQSANAAQSASVTASSVAQALMPNTFGDLKNWTWDYSNGTSDWSGDSRVRAFDHSTHGRVMEITNNPTFVPHIASKGRVALVRDHKYRLSVKWCLVGQQNGDVAVNASLFAIGLKPDNNQWNNINFYVSIAPGNVGWGWSNFATHVLDIDANTLIDQGCTWVRPLLRLESQGVYYVQSIDFRDVTSEVAAAASAAAASTSYSNALYEATLAAQRASAASGSANTASIQAGNAASSASAAAGSAATASNQAAAASSSASLASTYSTAGGNLLVNTEIVPDTSGWANYNSAGMIATHGRSQPSAEWVLTGEHTLSIVQPNNGSSGYAEWTQVINVKPNQWYDVSGLAAAHRCTVQVYFQWVDGNGSAGAAPSTGQFTPGTGGNKIQDWTNYGYKAQAPANAVRANLILRKFPTLSGQTDSWAWFCRPQVRETYADAPTPARYAPGRAGAVLSNMSASITTTQNTVATANAAIASHETRLQAAESNVSQTMGAVSDLQGRTTAYWQVQAVAGDGRAQMRLVADANGGGGVDIVGDLRVTGNALITGTVNPEALALGRFVKRLGPVNILTTNTGVLYSATLGETMGNGSYLLEGTVGFTYSAGRSQTTYANKPYYINYLNDGGVQVLIRKNGNLIASATWGGSLPSTYSTLAFGTGMTTNFDAPSPDTYTGTVTVEVVAFKGNTDTGIVNEGDYYTRTVSGNYTNFSFSNLRLKWTFI